MNLFITGGSGFIGHNLIEKLSKNHRILAPNHRELDLLDTEAVERFFNQNKVDTVIHCAVRPGHRNATDPSAELYHNTKMFFNLARNEKKFEKMIYLGSGLIYGLKHYQPMMKEKYSDEHIPEDEGGLSKYIISKYIEKHANIIELRIFGIFGKYEDYAIRFPSNLICKAVYNLPLTMNQNRRFSYIYIDDLAPIIEHFVKKKPKKYNIFNVTPDKQIELFELAKIIKEKSGTSAEIVVAKEGKGLEYTGDNSRLHQEIGNLRFTPLEEAIEKLYDWYLHNKKMIQKEVLLVDK